MTRKDDSGKTFLGFDLSTQKLKAVLLSEDLKIIAISEVKYDTDLPEYRTTGGALSGPHENEYTACPVMWIKAIDIVLDRLIMQGVDLSTVSCISASAQQHGSVFWSGRGVETLKSLDSNQFLHVQLDDSAFALTRSPIWMDSSTESQCIEMETAIGGRKEMVDITGSKCYPRFTGPQIRKVYQKRANVYQNCERISLISSFVASVFLGDVAAIDYSDASGMNLFDIKQKTWSKTCLNACAPDLEQRLGAAVPSNTIIGNVSTYFQERFGFSDDCKVSASTGDNSSALAGMVVDSNYLVISLGTSDTILMNMEHQTLLEEGHVLCHPIDTNLFMGLLCFRNGSLVRDALNKVEANGNWTVFNEHLESTPRGNFGNMAIHFHDTEIIPNARGILRWSKEHNIGSSDASRGVQKFSSPQIEIRALIEGQMLHHKAVAEDMGFIVGENTKIIATGGASINQSILQVVSDVFNAPVYTQEESESALLGAAYRAKYSRYLHDFNGDFGSAMKYHDYINQHLGNRLTEKCKPSKDCEQIYGPMLQRYRDMVTLLKIKDNE